MLTASQVCTDAAMIAKASGMLSIAGRQLNLVLNDLVLHRDMKMNRKQTTISVTPGTNGPFTLPTDYLRVYDLFYQVNNFPYFLFPLSQEQYDQLFKDPSIASYPYAYTTDLTAQATQAAGSLYIFPQSNTALAMTLRYMINRADITTPETSSTVPWMQDQDYLVHATAARIMKFTDDARWEAYEKAAEDMLRTHLIIGEGDEQKVVREIKLDPQRFHMNRTVRPTKISPY
jgi:hypothetical protein